MTSSVYICQKPEAYTWHELSFLQESVTSQDLKSKLQNLMDLLKEKTDSSAIFFMPKTSFDIFSFFQAQQNTPQFSNQDFAQIYSQVSLVHQSNPTKMSAHMEQKTKVLADFQNQVNPVQIPMDILSTL